MDTTRKHTARRARNAERKLARDATRELDSKPPSLVRYHAHEGGDFADAMDKLEGKVRPVSRPFATALARIRVGANWSRK